MAWTLKWGVELKTLLDIQANTGITPQGLLARVDPRPEVLKYWRMFWSLSQARSAGVAGADPIPVSEITAYLGLIAETEIAERIKCLHLVQGMDTLFLNHVRSKTQASKKP